MIDFGPDDGFEGLPRAQALRKLASMLRELDPTLMNNSELETLVLELQFIAAAFDPMVPPEPPADHAPFEDSSADRLSRALADFADRCDVAAVEAERHP